VSEIRRRMTAAGTVAAALLGACSSPEAPLGGDSDGGSMGLGSGGSSAGRAGSISGSSSGHSSGIFFGPGPVVSGSFSSGISQGSSSGSSTGGSASGSSSGLAPSSGLSSGSSSGSSPGGPSGTGLFAACSLTGGCMADCSPAADDPLASSNPGLYDVYDGCIVAGLEAGGFAASNIPFIGGLLKGEVLEESGAFTPSVDMNTGDCGGWNCGMWAISAGKPSGDSAPGPCGSSATDLLTGQVDMSHSYGLLQDTPACEGTFIMSQLPAGYTCTGTGTYGYSGSGILPFSTSDRYFYCESAVGNGVMNLTGQMVKGAINAITDSTDPYYKLSIFNPAYYFLVHLGYSLPNEYKQANMGVPSSCSSFTMMYKAIAYWLNGDASMGCSVPSGGGQGGNLQYIQTCIANYQMIYGKTWPYPMPM